MIASIAQTQNTQFRNHHTTIANFVSRALSVEDNYRYHIKGFASFAQDSKAESVMELVRDYFERLNTTSYAASTIRCKRQAVKDRLRRSMADPHITDRQRAAFEHQLKELDRDPQTKCPGGASGSSGANKTVSTEEYNRLMQNARSERQKRFIEFLYTTGVRVSEMTGIQHADCKREGNVIAIRIRGKGNRKQSYKERTVWITKAMYERIRETFAGEEYLFETGKGRRYSRSYVSNQIAKLTQAVLGRKLSAHKLRHTFVTNKLNETGRVKAVSQYVGHSDVQITLRIYGHDTFSPADLLGPEAVA